MNSHSLIRTILTFRRKGAWTLSCLVFFLLACPANGRTRLFRDYVKNYSPSEYLGDSQIWSIEKDDQGFTYFAAGTRLSVFDGIEWESYEIEGRPVIRSLRFRPENGRLYCAGDNFFGYWVRDGKGALAFHSLYKNDNPLDGKVFWRIFPTGNGLIVQTHSNVYVYCGSDRISSLTSGNVGYSFVTGGKYYVQIDDCLYYLYSDKFSKIAEGIQDRLVSFDYVGDNEFIGVGETSGFHSFQYDRQTGKYLHQEIFGEVSQSLSKLKIFTSVKVSDGWLVGTVIDGAYHISDTGEIVDNWNTGNGVKYPTILSIHEGEAGEMAFGTDGGISVVARNVARDIYLSNPDKIGYVYAMSLWRDKLYIGTNKGLFVASEKSPEPDMVEGSQGQIWSLLPNEHSLFVVADKGLYNIDESGHFTFFCKDVRFLTRSPSRQGMYLASDKAGLFVVEMDNSGNIRKNGHLKNFDKHEISIHFDRYGQMWVDNMRGHTYKLTVDTDLKSVTRIESYDVGNDRNAVVRIFHVDNDIIFTSGKLCYSYDPYANKIKPNDYYTDLFDAFETESLNLLQTGRYIFNHNGTQVDLLERDGETLRMHRDIFRGVDFEQIPRDFRGVVKLSDSMVACGFYGCIGTYDLSAKASETPRPANLYRVSYSRQDETLDADLVEGGIFLPEDARDIHFRFCVPICTDLEYRLDEGNWSNVTATQPVVLRYLDSGEHQLDVRCEGETVLRLALYKQFPVYLRWWFIALSLTVIGLLTLTLTIMYRRRIRRLHQRYEARQDEMLEKERILHQNEMLALQLKEKDKKLAVQTLQGIATNNMIDCILAELSDAVKSEDMVGMTSAKRIMNKYRKKDGDWKVFESYFNGIFDGFLDRLITSYPKLTQNDVKICMFIRLGLSTKEIASQLNIGISSAESARYRLRKNMGIPQEASLRDTISKI